MSMSAFVFSHSGAFCMHAANSAEPAQQLCTRRHVLSLALGVTLASIGPVPAVHARVHVAEENAGQDVHTTQSGLMYYDFIVGTGNSSVGCGSQVTLHFTFGSTGARNGWKIDSTYDREPLTITVGSGEVIQGLDECLYGMKKGGRRRCLIPDKIGFKTDKDMPVPPGFAEYQRFKNLYLNRNRPYSPDVVFDIEVLRMR